MRVVVFALCGLSTAGLLLVFTDRFGEPERVLKPITSRAIYDAGPAMSVDVGQDVSVDNGMALKFGQAANDYMVIDRAKPETFLLGYNKARIVYDGKNWTITILDPDQVRCVIADAGRDPK